MICGEWFTAGGRAGVMSNLVLPTVAQSPENLHDNLHAHEQRRHSKAWWTKFCIFVSAIKYPKSRKIRWLRYFQFRSFQEKEVKGSLMNCVTQKHFDSFYISIISMQRRKLRQWISLETWLSLAEYLHNILCANIMSRHVIRHPTTWDTRMPECQSDNIIHLENRS